MRIFWTMLFLAAVALGSAAQAGQAAQAPVQAGEAWPPMTFPVPASAGQAAYLGLGAGQKSFVLAQVKASYLLVEVFSMYCPFCQADAPQVNQLFDLIKSQKLEGALKMVGLGAGNSEFEVGVFRQKFAVAFPLLPDSDFSAHQALGQPRTPYFLLLKLQGTEPPQIIFSHLGSIGQAPQFLATLKEKAGLP